MFKLNRICDPVGKIRLGKALKKTFCAMSENLEYSYPTFCYIFGKNRCFFGLFFANFQCFTRCKKKQLRFHLTFADRVGEELQKCRSYKDLKVTQIKKLGRYRSYRDREVTERQQLQTVGGSDHFLGLKSENGPTNLTIVQERGRGWDRKLCIQAGR